MCLLQEDGVAQGCNTSTKRGEMGRVGFLLRLDTGMFTKRREPRLRERLLLRTFEHDSKWIPVWPFSGINLGYSIKGYSNFR